MSFRRYESYRDSGVEWLGEVPSHWTVCHLKRVARLTYGDPLPADIRNDGGDIEVFGSNGPVGRHDQANTSSPAILIGRKGSHGALNWSDQPAFAIDTVYFVDRRSCQAELRWLYWALHPLRLDSLSQDTGVPGLAREIAHETSLAVAPAHEQCAIVAFVDRETAKIDALVEEQRRLIELLKEKRQAVISHAVTKGLNPAAPMKDSGVEWLGEVPAHWAVRRIKQIARMESGHTPDRKVSAYWENCTIPWVSLHDTGYLKGNDYISETAQCVNELGLSNSSARLLPERAVVFSRDATIGRCAITTRPMAVSQHFIAWLCSEVVVPEHLLFCLRSMEHELEKLTFGATLKTIGMPDVRKLTIAVPPLSEQKAIVEHIRASATKLDELIDAAVRASLLLTERRAALIGVAVTGKIDVRNEAAREKAA